MKDQEQYDKAIELVDQLEAILGTDLSIYAYDGQSPREELWYKFATEEEKKERHKRRQEELARWYESAPFGNISQRTAKWAERKMLEHAQPVAMLERLVSGGIKVSPQEPLW